jgi:hypothetical protein
MTVLENLEMGGYSARGRSKWFRTCSTAGQCQKQKCEAPVNDTATHRCTEALTDELEPVDEFDKRVLTI